MPRLSTEYDLEQHDRMAREHAAWLDVCQELLNRGVNLDHPADDALAGAIRKWGEELHQLRAGDPDPQHADTALAEHRAGYEGQYERGTYPEPLRRVP